MRGGGGRRYRDTEKEGRKRDRERGEEGERYRVRYRVRGGRERDNRERDFSVVPKKFCHFYLPLLEGASSASSVSFEIYGIFATSSFKKSHCCSSLMQCFLV